MSRDEIPNMPASREMDALIDKHVFGFVFPCDTRCPVCGFSYSANRETGCVRGDCSLRPVPARRADESRHYSTNIAAAWEVVEKMAHDGILVRVDVSESCGNLIWWCEMAKEDDESEEIKKLADVRMVENSAPLAICRAALLAVTEE